MIHFNVNIIVECLLCGRYLPLKEAWFLLLLWSCLPLKNHLICLQYHTVHMHVQLYLETEEHKNRMKTGIKNE